MKSLLSLLLVGLALAAGCSQGARDPKTKGRFQEEAIKRGSLKVLVKARGTIEPEEVIDIGAQVNGAIQEFGPDLNKPNKTIDFGSRVKKGAILARIDPALYEIQLKSARASLSRAEASCLRAKARVVLTEREVQRLQKREAEKKVEVVDVEVAKANLEVARAEVLVEEAVVAERKAAVQNAEANLDYTVIRAPVDGVVLDRRVNVGTIVTASLNAPSLFLIGKNLKKLQVWASVKEADIGQVAEGQPASFTVDAFPKRVFKGKVSGIRLTAATDKNAQVTFIVVVDIDNSDEKLKPYLTAEVSIEVAERKDVLLVPNAALQWRPILGQVAVGDRVAYLKRVRTDEPTVWIEDKGLVRMVPVKIGMTDGAMTEVVKGDLSEGARVVTGEASD